MTSKQNKIFLTSLMIREMHIEVTVRYYYAPNRDTDDTKCW